MYISRQTFRALVQGSLLFFIIISLFYAHLRTKVSSLMPHWSYPASSLFLCVCGMHKNQESSQVAVSLMRTPLTSNGTPCSGWLLVNRVLELSTQTRWLGTYAILYSESNVRIPVSSLWQMRSANKHKTLCTRRSGYRILILPNFNHLGFF